MYLEKINGPEDLKKIPEKQLPVLAAEIRRFLVSHVSRTGGHLASNLGVVELTIALHRVLDLPKDKLIWDVGHQSYTHKLLTGRREGFDSLRAEGGMSGFPKSAESPCDAFETGHSSTAVSAGLGLAWARDLAGRSETVVSVLGDGALTGGMSFEALNNASRLKTNFIIVLNDNEMSISHNIGGISRYLSGLRTSESYTALKVKVQSGLEKIPVVGPKAVRSIRRTKSSLKQLLVPGMFFEDMGITYLGPVNGHDIPAVEKILREAKRYPGAVIVHVKTVKGKGYEPAEQDPSRFHGIGPFVPATGRDAAPKKAPTWTDIFSEWLMRAAQQYPELVAVTAAMPEGTGLVPFRSRYPQRFFDVGIAEEHAVTFAAGMAAGGLVPVVAVYSSFLQRAYDQILHDVCLKRRHVIFAVDRAGLVGADGETHQGIYDLSFLRSIPGLTVMAPKNAQELTDMLDWALAQDGPVAIRYPRGTACTEMADHFAPVENGRAEVLRTGTDAAIFAIGSMVREAMKASDLLREQGVRAAVVNARFADPVDAGRLAELGSKVPLLVTVEENVESGGYGEAAAAALEKAGSPAALLRLSLPDAFVPQGNAATLRAEYGLDAEGIAKRVLQKIRLEAARRAAAEAETARQAGRAADPAGEEDRPAGGSPDPAKEQS